MSGTLSVEWLSDHSVIIQGIDSASIPAVEGKISSRHPFYEVRRGLESLMVSSLFPKPDLLGEISALLAQHDPNIREEAREEGAGFREIVVPVDYSGRDLPEVAARLDMAPEEFVALHRETVWTVHMLGFAPGFPYLKPLSETRSFDIPRHPSPRVRVPAGSVGIAAGLSCIYPSEMPGGWWLIGSTDLVLFDASSNTPALFSPGDRVRFEEAK